MIDKWDSYAVDSGAVDLTAGAHNIRVEYEEFTGEAHLKLTWTFQPPTTPTPGPDHWSVDYFSDQ